MNTGIIAAGCTFPSGPSLALADIAIRTQLALIRNHPFWVDRCNEPVKVSCFPQQALPFDVTRWQTLADQALQDAMLHNANNIAHPTRLWLILPPLDRPGLPDSLDSALRASLSVHLPDCEDITVLRGSHAEAANAIHQACEKQQTDKNITLDIVLAVDCWLPPESMTWLEQQHLLHGSHVRYGGNTRRNPYGRIPGEGAAVIILAPEFKLPAWCRLQSIATAQEEVLQNSDKPCLAIGLSQATRMAINDAGNPIISHIVTDTNGEPYRADEYGFTVSRLHNVPGKDLQHIAPVLASGDIGCASLVMHLAQAAWWLKQNANNTEETAVLVLASSDDSQRGAAVLRPANQGKNTA